MTATSPMTLPDDNRSALRRVARSCRKAALATNLVDGGGPYVSLVTVALDHDLAPILLLSALADHTRNLAADARVSLLFDGTDGHPNPQTGPRLTLTGLAERTDDPRLKARFLARHPAAALYAGFADFALWRVAPARGHFVGGFGRAVWFDAPFGLTAPVAEWVREEQRLIADEGVAAAAATIANRSPSDGDPWRLTAIDSDGVEVVSGETCLRVAFARPAASPAELAATLATHWGGNY